MGKNTYHMCTIIFSVSLARRFRGFDSFHQYARCVCTGQGRVRSAFSMSSSTVIVAVGIVMEFFPPSPLSFSLLGPDLLRLGQGSV